MQLPKLYTIRKCKGKVNNNNNNAVFQAVTLCYILLDGHQIFRLTTVSFHTDLLPATCTRFTFITQRSYMFSVCSGHLQRVTNLVDVHSVYGNLS